MRLFGYPYNNDLVICKDSPDLDYLKWVSASGIIIFSPKKITIIIMMIINTFKT